MPLDGKTKMDPTDVFSEPYVQIFQAIVNLKERQKGPEIFEQISRLGSRILSQVTGEEKGLALAALTFAVLSTVEAWPAVRKALESKDSQIWRPS